MLRLPFTLPGAHLFTPGQRATSTDVDTGGYDFTIGGHGFRLATDQQFYYSRATEPTTTRRFDDSSEPGEQSLSPLPWIKSQASFHGGAGQQNLEQGRVSLQYQEQQIEHVRFDTSLGVDVWTPGKVTRLPDTRVTGFSGRNATVAVTGTDNGNSNDVMVAGGPDSLFQLTWSDPDSPPSINNIDLSGTTFGGATNCNVLSLATDGESYYALIHLDSEGSIVDTLTLIVRGDMGSTMAPTVIYTGPADSSHVFGALGWVKARLVAGLGNAFYALDSHPVSAVVWTTLTPRYSHPAPSAVWTAFCDSPTAILGSAVVGQQSEIIAFTLDDVGDVPTLTGGATVAILPPGERIESLGSLLNSFLAVGTTYGLRIGTFDTYSGQLRLGPLSVKTTHPVRSMTGRDRFIYAGYTNQQADGSTGLVRADLSFPIDNAGRLAYAPDLRPPTTAISRVGEVTAVSLLPTSGRLVFIAPDGVHVEGPGAGADGEAWLKTSRIRYDTAEMKLFKYGRVHGSLDTATIQVTGSAPFQSDVNLGTFGFIVGGDPGEFGLPNGPCEWIQLKFSLSGADCVLNSYQVRAFPAPQRQHIITLTANCFVNETDRFGLSGTDPESPRKRFQNIADLESAGEEIRFVEFTNQGSVAQLVIIDQIEFKSFSRPNVENDFGGYITMKLRITQ